MAFPYLVYLASVGTCSSPPQADGDTLINTTDVAMGISHVYERSATHWYYASAVNFSTSYFSISLALNVTLTSMIVTRVILHRRGLRRALEASDGLSGVYTAIATMIIESYALYAVALLAYTIPWAIGSPVTGIFSKTAGAIQVRSFFTFPQCSVVLGHCSLIMFTHRSSLRI
jgi:hypothetical protein